MINKLNDKELCGRGVRLDNAKSTPSSGARERGGGRGGRGTPRGGGGRGGRGARNNTPSKTLMAFNLSFNTESYTLQEIFEGSNDVYLPLNRETGEKRGSAPIVILIKQLINYDYFQ